MRTLRFILWPVAALSASLAGCSGVEPLRALGPRPGVDVDSASAAAVRTVQNSHYAYPDLKRIPRPPADARAAPAYGVAAAGLRGERETLLRWGAEHPAEQVDAPGYAKAQRARLPDPATDAPTPDQSQKTAEWAARAREAAKPPPPPN